MKTSKIVKRSLITIGTIMVLLVVAHVLVVLNFDRLTNRVVEDPRYSVSKETRAVHFSSFIADLHSDALMWNRDLLNRNALGHVDLPRLVDGGVTLQVFGAGTNFPLGPSLVDEKSEDWPDYYTFHSVLLGWPRKTFGSQLQRAIYLADRLHDAAEQSDGQLRLILTVDELDKLVRDRSQRVIGGLLALEGANALGRQISNLGVLCDAGFRVIGLAHFVDNPFAGSANGMQKYGLTQLGSQLIRKMEELGLVPDLAHASQQTVRDVLNATDKPILVSHTGVKATCDRDRNLSDDSIRAIAEAGGVIGISFGELLICGDRIDDIVRSLEHVVRLVGDEHVAYGSDFDGGVTVPFDVSGLPQLSQAMIDASFGKVSIRRILGENVLRVLHAWLPASKD